LKILLENKHKVYVLSRAKGEKKAETRIQEALTFWDRKFYTKHRNNLFLLEGDVAEKDLGIKSGFGNLLKEVEEIFHCAAVTVQNWPLEKIRKVNVSGTKNILELAINSKNLIKVNHLSTAYVCGTYKGIFKEADLDVGQTFNTTYEQSKFEAEKLIQQYRKKGLLIDIYRPALVIGESKTGKINEFRNIYQFLSLCKMNLFDVLPIKDGSVNLIPVDACAHAIYFASSKNQFPNRTFHVFPPDRLSLKEILKKSSLALGFKNPKLVSKMAKIKLTPAQRIILTNPVFSFNFYVKLDSILTNKFLLSNGLRLNFNELNFNKMISFFRERTEQK
jgi:long-chain acyl-CoA synthetase